jgi:hypothetical protein
MSMPPVSASSPPALAASSSAMVPQAKPLPAPGNTPPSGTQPVNPWLQQQQEAKLKEDANQASAMLLGLPLAVAVGLISHKAVAQWIDGGHMVKLAQAADAKLGIINTALAHSGVTQLPLVKKFLTQQPYANVAKDGLTDALKGAIAWADQHLPEAASQQWRQQLQPHLPPEQVLKVIEQLQKTATHGSAKAQKQLKGLATRIDGGIINRYLKPYQHTQNIIKAGKLGHVGQAVVHVGQTVRNLLSGEFMMQTVKGKGSKPASVSPMTVAFNNAFTLAIPMAALLSSEKGQKAKRFGEELWGNAFGNFLGWYWGAHWLNHTGLITKALNGIKPGLATQPLLMGTYAGVFTEFLASLGVGSLIGHWGKQFSYATVGKPKQWIDPKLPADYAPLIKQHPSFNAIMAQTGPVTSGQLALSQVEAGAQRLTQLPPDQLNQLMQNTHGMHSGRVSRRPANNIKDPVFNQLMQV